MERDRGFRRRQQSRARRRAIRFLKDVCCYEKIHERQIWLYAKHRKPCSCYRCSGNKQEEHKWERRELNKELRKDFEQEDMLSYKKKYSY